MVSIVNDSNQFFVRVEGFTFENGTDCGPMEDSAPLACANALRQIREAELALRTLNKYNVRVASATIMETTAEVLYSLQNKILIELHYYTVTRKYKNAEGEYTEKAKSSV